MIKTLQKKFIITAMIAITVLIFFMLGTINVINVIMVRNNLNQRLHMLSENEGDPNNLPRIIQYRQDDKGAMRPKDDRDKMLSSNFFLVRFDAAGDILYVDVRHTATVSEDDAIEMAKKIYFSQKTSGKTGKYHYLVSPSRFNNGSTVVFLDVTDENISYFRVLLISLGIGTVCWFLMLLLVIQLSRKAIQPIAENIEKQKQFITNAGHEIKTPLAIIQSNTDAMELINGETKWSKNIKNQIARLDGLTKNMLFLAKMDEGNIQNIITTFSISELLRVSVQDFMEPLSLKHITVYANIEDNITIDANKEQIAQLISIFLDNALKYTNESGTLSISLEKPGKKRIISFVNTCDALPEVSSEKLFDRFFRSDKARTQKSGGYGIGLSVAKSIVEYYSGSISASYEPDNTIRFTVKI